MRRSAQAAPAVRAEFEAKQARFFGVSVWDAQSELTIDSALIAWLAQEVAPVNAAALTGKLNLLKQKVEGLASGGSGPFSAQRPVALDALLVAEGLEPAEDEVLATDSGGQAYIGECAALGVPTPPTWGSSQWRNRGVITNEFISSGLDAEVYTYSSTSPEGTCIALPRASGNTIELLGIICLGRASSVACFWDNQQGSPGQQFPIQKGTTVPISQFNGRADLEFGTGG